jgi:hypothetical protein
MFKPGFLLFTDAHLQAAMFNRSIVCVWQNGEVIDYGSRIEEVSNDAVRIKDGWFLKTVCEFRIR